MRPSSLDILVMNVKVKNLLFMRQRCVVLGIYVVYFLRLIDGTNWFFASGSYLLIMDKIRGVFEPSRACQAQSSGHELALRLGLSLWLAKLSKIKLELGFAKA